MRFFKKVLLCKGLDSKQILDCDFFLFSKGQTRRKTGAESHGSSRDGRAA